MRTATLKHGSSLARATQRHELGRFRTCIPMWPGSIITELSHLTSILAVCTPRGYHMTSVPQTRQRSFPAQDSRRRTASTVPGSPETSGAARGRARQALPAVDPSTAFGCVDWFLYPDQAVGRSAAESQANRLPS